jgi:starvation-inducible DNA-binding protein
MMAQTKLDKSATEAVGRKLQSLLADAHIVYGHLHALHWNVEGPQFFTLHRELQSMYEGLAETIDDIAERILMLGNRPASTYKEYLATTSLEELQSRKYTGEETAQYVIKDLAHLMKEVRELVEVSGEHNDEGTADFGVGMLREFEKQNWFWSAFAG